jgi:hypothetical protein
MPSQKICSIFLGSRSFGRLSHPALNHTGITDFDRRCPPSLGTILPPFVAAQGLKRYIRRSLRLTISALPNMAVQGIRFIWNKHPMCRGPEFKQLLSLKSMIRRYLSWPPRPSFLAHRPLVGLTRLPTGQIIPPLPCAYDARLSRRIR